MLSNKEKGAIGSYYKLDESLGNYAELKTASRQRLQYSDSVYRIVVKW